MQQAKLIVKKAAEREIQEYIAAHTITNIFYIHRKQFTVEERREIIPSICDIFNVINIDAKKILSAIDNEGFSDFEDCLQEECAMECGAEYLVIRNVKDFQNAKVRIITPEKMLLSIGYS